ncbi:signal peptidase I [Microbacterium abyssi]|uniref:signal peptidase I n=1 Tax=Microbacterium abyssi TaxID=2782166 RepID=UPI001E37B3C4|nr:signal peptidase I [Microbacterium sp. A18JL241]
MPMQSRRALREAQQTPATETPATESRAPAERRLSRPTPMRIVLRVLGWVAFTVVMVVLAVAIVIPRLLGAVPLAVLTSSMEPTLPPGTLVVVKPVDPEALGVGDVVTFQPVSDDPLLVTHRIVGVGYQADGEITFTTRGDNNGIDDEPIAGAQVMGEVIYSVPFVGYATTVFSSTERGWIVGAIGGLLIGYAVFTIIRELRRKRVQRPAGAEQ